MVQYNQMKMKNDIDDQGKSDYYFKLLYEKSWQILTFAITYFDQSRNERLDKYYQEFRSYLFKMVILERFDTWRDIVHKLPANLHEETLNEDEALGNWYELQVEAREGLMQLKDVELNITLLPKWITEAMCNIEEWLEPLIDLDENLTRHALDTLSRHVEKLNEQLQAKIIIKPDGIAQFHSPTGRIYTGAIRLGTNEYNMLKYLNESVGTVKEAKEIASKLNKLKAGADDNVKRRVTDTASAIKNSLNLKDAKDIFIVNRGYGLKYPVEFISHNF